jgi:hypothetical protein
MAQGVDGHSPSDNSDKTRLREASIMTGMTKYEWQKPPKRAFAG